MYALITFNPETKTHKWATTVYDDDGKFVFGAAIDATTEEEAREKVKRLWDDYENSNENTALRRYS